MAVDWHMLVKLLSQKFGCTILFEFSVQAYQTEHIKLTNTTQKTCISFQRTLITLEGWYYRNES